GCRSGGKSTSHRQQARAMPTGRPAPKSCSHQSLSPSWPEMRERGCRRAGSGIPCTEHSSAQSGPGTAPVAACWVQHPPQGPSRRPRPPSLFSTGGALLRLAFPFLLIAILAALFCFTGVAAASSWVAQVVFLVFLVLFLLSLIG